MIETPVEQPIRLLATVPFHFRSSRLEYLFQTVRSISRFPIAALDLVIVTNVDQEECLGQIRNTCQPLLKSFPGGGQKNLFIESQTQLKDPWMLTWCHKRLITDDFLKKDYTHFLYIEDDILLSFENFIYFLHYRDRLKEYGLLPAFQRIEYNKDDNRLYLCDQIGISDFKARRSVKLDGYDFVNIDYPWSAVFILDRELALEHIGTKSFDAKLSESVRPDWMTPCRAGMGLTFENIPAGFTQRGVSPVNPQTLTTPCWSWVYHLPNNYTTDQLTPLGKTRVDELFAPDLDWREPPKLINYSLRVKRKISVLTGL